MKFWTHVCVAGLLLFSACLSRAEEKALPVVEEKFPDAPAGKSSEPAREEPALPASEKKSPDAQAGKSSEPAKDDGSLPWLDNLEAAETQARTLNRPLLVRIGGPGCPWCVKLDQEIRKSDVQRELARWNRVYIDIEQNESEAARLGVGPIPALRLLAPGGKTVASHDGFLASDELVAWLGKHFDEAASAIPDVLTAVGPPDMEALAKLIAEFDQPDPVRRESAIRRLLPYANLSAKAVAQAFAEGRLSTRLATLDLLASWKAPVEGLDPWRPDSVTEARRKKLIDWAQATNPISADDKHELSPEQLATAREDIAKLLSAKAPDVAGIRERLARLGTLGLPLVYEQLKKATDDQARGRLLALRYRLVASDALVLSWPGGLEQLASMDARVRHQAAEQFLTRATNADQPLLLELFSDGDPLMRELSLRGLRRIGGASSSSALVKLLNDPEPNVRAAVLKELAEKPSSDLVPTIVAYVKREKDSDLLVHAIRCLKGSSDRRAIASLQSLLKHESWQVRAEATEVVGALVVNHAHGDSTQLENTSSIYAALVEALDDEDGFVVSRAMTGLASLDLLLKVEPLAKAAQRHPDLADKILPQLISGQQTRKAGLEKLRGFLTHKDPRLRAAALEALAGSISQDLEKDILAGLSDAESMVRIAAARALLVSIEITRPGPPSEPNAAAAMPRLAVRVRPQPAPQNGILDVLTLLFGGGVAPPPERVVEPVPPPVAPQPATPAPVVQPARVPVAPPAATPAAPDVAGPSAPASVISPPAAPDKTEEKSEPMEDWLVAYRGGAGRRSWLAGAAEPLIKMLAAAEAQERLVAAIALLPLARDSEALPVLKQAIKDRPREMETASKALTWLPWPARLELLHYLLDLKPDHTQMRHVIHSFVIVKTKKSREILWKLLEGAPLVEVAITIQGELSQLYEAGNYLYNPQMVTLPRHLKTVAELKVYATGAPWQRVVALSLLLAISQGDVIMLAPKTLEDSSIPADLRRDVLQIWLVAMPGDGARKMAGAYVASPDAPLRKLAMRFLLARTQSMPTLRGSIYLQSPANIAAVQAGANANEKKIPTAPEGLKPEALRPLLGDADPEIVAGAAYLLATLGDEKGFEKLLALWRKTSSADRGLAQMVYRAIAIMDKSSHVPLLEEIYGKLSRDEMGEFYWTIRSMHGVEVLKLRKRIRQEVGMANLQASGATNPVFTPVLSPALEGTIEQGTFLEE